MRPTPFDLAFGTEAETRFPPIRESLKASGRDPHDADAFILDREVVTLLRELVPEEGVGEAVQQHVALLQHAYLYWDHGGWLFRLTKDRAKALLTTARWDCLAPGSRQGAPVGRSVAEPPRAYYIQFPERLVWAELAPDEPHQPLDGLFVRPWPGEGYFVLAIFGMHPGQAGFSVVDVDGYREGELQRADGSSLFGAVLAGGAAAGLHSIVGGEELLELAARTASLAADAQACVAGNHHAHQPVEIG
jgi:hypothetical protein